jgi:solute carrier family 25 phosphate transporter 23/24/25/41
VGERIVSDDTQATHQESSSTASAVKTRRKFELTEFIPDPGYFLAGAVAGGVSRTATAPLDRLKVYLLVNTGTGSANAAKAINSVASGRPLGLVKNALRPFSDAIRDLFRSGGIKGFFAGER